MVLFESRLPLVSCLLRVVFVVGLGSLVAGCERSLPVFPSDDPSTSVGIVGSLKEDGIHVLVSLRGKYWEDLSLRRRLSVSTQAGKVVFELPLNRTPGGTPPPLGPWEFVVDASTTKLQWEIDLHDKDGKVMGAMSEEIEVDLTKDPVLTNVPAILHDLFFPSSPRPSTNR